FQMIEPLHVHPWTFLLILTATVEFVSSQDFTPKCSSSSCCDNHRFCEFWAGKRECISNPTWMHENCGRSCGTCSTVTRSAPLPPRDESFCTPPATVVFPTRPEPSVQEVRSQQRATGCARVATVPDCGRNRCFHERYRTFDGSCNNLQNPLLGAAFTPFSRLLPAQYDDGIKAVVSTLRRTRPSAREVSHFLLSSRRSIPSSANSLLMQFGQFLSHDITKNGLNNFCDCSTRDAECANIPIPVADQRRRSIACIRFTRAVAVCGTGSGGTPREQFNENSAFIDGSQIYGSDSKSAAALRAGAFLRAEVVGGRVFPPNNRRDSMQTGDDRSNLFVGLSALHTTSLRLHNNIAASLQNINPRWDSNRIFEETRKIVGACMQVVTYHEFLPALLGPFFDRLVPPYAEYDKKMNSAILNEFSAAAYRLHGMLQEFYPLLDSNFRQSGSVGVVEGMFQLHRILESGLDHLYRGLISIPARSPQRITTAVTELIMSGEGDMASINIQRGRDHGLQSYNHYRKLCNLRALQSFDEWTEVSDQDVRKRVSELYSSPEELDLYTGGILEEPADNSLVGPTFACIISEQFVRLREGDRHYWENPSTFTQEQREALTKVSLSWIICSTSDRMDRISSHPFTIDNGTNAVQCSSIPSLDLRPWRE
ncbi:hypothetical protein PFISCL1PPCAC_5692, partial [Pristionchus fissidentatus]